MKKLDKSSIMTHCRCLCKFYLSNCKTRNGGPNFFSYVCTLFKKNAILCLFPKNGSPSKRVVCFILNNLHFPMVEDIAFYALHKLRVLIILCKADGFCLFIGLPDEIYKKALGIVIQFRILFFHCFVE